MIIDEIIAHKRTEIAGLAERIAGRTPARSQRDFAGALQRQGAGVRVIAELKRRSPSEGDIASADDLLARARAYEEGGAAAISVLTDEFYFGGDGALLQAVGQVVELPLLRKDFIMTPAQVVESRLLGADAVLLMVRVVPEVAELRALRELAERYGMDALVEAHTAQEVAIAVESGAKIVGVNARDFTDMSVDIARVPPLLAQLPTGVTCVAESGLGTLADVGRVAPMAEAILVGTSLMRRDLPTVRAFLQGATAGDFNTST